jgi:hypothetical protein
MRLETTEFADQVASPSSLLPALESSRSAAVLAAGSTRRGVRDRAGALSLARHRLADRSAWGASGRWNGRGRLWRQTGNRPMSRTRRSLIRER